MNPGILSVLLAAVVAIPGKAPAVSTGRKSVELAENWHFQIDVPEVGEKENWQAMSFDHSQWTRVKGAHGLGFV